MRGYDGQKHGLFYRPVFKNKKMPGQMGNVKRTVQNLEIVKIDEDFFSDE